MAAIYKNGVKYGGSIKLDVVQTTGTSTVQVMSQNAVTTSLGGKQDTLPTTSTVGKVLKSTATAGTVEWGDVDGLPSQSGQSGKFLTTNGTSASWGTVAVPSVVQATGSSTTDVMSQNAVTTALNAKQNTTTAVTHTASTAVGSATKPVYVNSSGVATATTYSLSADVPSNVASLTSTNFVASEKVYNQGSTASITLTNGRIFYCTGSSITLPTAVDGVCITCIVTASSVTWGGSIRWKGAKAPTLTANYDLVSFVGYSGYWYGA